MNTSQGGLSYKNPSYPVEWKLLAFLVLFMDVKLVVKVLGLVLVYILRPDFRFGFKWRQSRLPLFYLLIIGIAVLNFSLAPDFRPNYLLVLLNGILVWVACILAIHQMKLFTERTETATLHNTLTVFFVLNIAISLLNLSTILLDIGLQNPFLYQGQFQKYFINTGDFIKGLSLDSSTTNALISCFGVVYFLFRNKFLLATCCMVTLLLTASNFGCIVMLLVLAAIFIFKSTAEQKSIITVNIFLLVLFFVKISPQNGVYAASIFNHYILGKKDDLAIQSNTVSIRDTPDSLLTPESTKEKIAILFLDSLEREKLYRVSSFSKFHGITGSKRPQVPQVNINKPFYQSRLDTNLLQRQLISLIQSSHDNPDLNIPEGTAGKLVGFRQSLDFLRDHQNKLIAGDGIGNFSSKLAFRATGLKIAGSFPAAFTYCNTDFLKNHFLLYAHFFIKPSESHSLVHNPASVYDQLLTEYGLAGLLAFAVCYLGFFLRYKKYVSYGFAALAVLLTFFLVDYWFEQLSVVVLFELIMFLNIKENLKTVHHA